MCIGIGRQVRTHFVQQEQVPYFPKYFEKTPGPTDDAGETE
jgi:hypothetical protein